MASGGSDIGFELTAAEQFLMSRLSTDATLRSLALGGFHSEELPTSPEGLSVMWQFQGALGDTTTLEGIRILANPLYLVVAVFETTDPNAVEAAAERIDIQLQGAPPQSMPGGYLMRSCSRERPYSRTERLVDVEWRYAGGYYRIVMAKP